MKDIHHEDQHPRPTSDPKQRRRKEATPTLPPEIIKAIEEAVQRRYVNPNAEAYSIHDFCEVYGVGRQMAYDELKAGRLKAKKPGDTKRTLIPRAEAQRWLDDSPDYMPRAAKMAPAADTAEAHRP